MTNRQIERISNYQEAYLADYGFEAVMVRFRQRRILETLERVRPSVVLEVGCGAELLYEQFFRHHGAIERWLIVEPAQSFFAVAAASATPNLTAVQGFFEDVAEKIHCILPRAPDLVICSGLLHEVADPCVLLSAIRGIMGEASIMHVNVPNATSFHRCLAKSMGLIDNLITPSDRNVQLMQYRVYDRDSLRLCLEFAGFSIILEGGYFLKPFTHRQMEKITPELDEDVLDGLFRLGQELPELASEIFAEVQLA